MIVEINDMNTPMMQAIRNVSREVAFEHMSKIGNKVKVNAGKKMNQQRHRHSWLQQPRKTARISRLEKRGNKKVRVYGAKKLSELSPYYSKTRQKNLGQRTRPEGSLDSPASMSNMISSFLMEKSGVLIVGGKNKAFTPVKRKDGEIVGVEKRQSSITAHSQSIIHKLDTGERNRFHGWGASGSLKSSMPNFEKARYRGRRFMRDGFNQSIPYMKQELTSGYVKTVGRAVNKVKVRLKPSKRIVS